MSQTSIDALAFCSDMIKLGKNYLLLGTDLWMIDHVLRMIQSGLKKRHDLETINLYADDLDKTELSEVLDTYSIFASSKLVVLRNAEQLNSQEQQVLGSYFKDPSELQSLIIVAMKVDGRLSSWKAVSQASVQISCDPPRSHYDLQKWLDFVLKQSDKQMDSQAKRIFLSRVELDYATAYNELQKLFLLVNERKTVSEKDVQRSLGTSRVGTMIDFYRALGKRNLAECLNTIGRMLDSDWEGLQVFFLFTKFYNTIHHILALKANQTSESEISSRHLAELFPSQRQEYIGFAKNYTLKQMRCIMRVLLEIDSQFKLSAAPSHTLLELCAIRIMGCR